eukprot:PhF_6_TR26394/c0_g1_i2/m.38111/K09849/TRAF5; TNF receptor-associated factor 5
MSCRSVSCFVDPVDQEFLCPIGCGVLVNPVRAPCEHEYCKHCIVERIKADTSKSIKCPAPGCSSNQPITEKDLANASKTARMTERLVLYCDNQGQGCSWNGQWGKLASHRAQECMFESVRCSHAGCNENAIQRRNLAAHRAICPYRTDRCEFCGRSFKSMDLDTHYQSCEEKPVTCPQRCGLVGVKRKEINKHVEEVCGKTIVPCPFSHMGCAVQVFRENVGSHLGENLASHLAMVATTAHKIQTTTNAELDSLRTVVKSNSTTVTEELRQELNTTKEEIKGLRSYIDRLMGGSVVIVDTNGAAMFRTITSALQVVKQNDTIVLRSGLYTENVMFENEMEGITVQGAANVPRDTIRIEVTTEIHPVVNFKGVGNTFRHATLIQKQRSAQCVRFEPTSGNNLLEDCSVESINLSCVVIIESAIGNNVVRGCDIRNSKQNGVLLKGFSASTTSPLPPRNATGQRSLPHIVEDCVISDHKQANVLVEGYESECMSVIMRRNTIARSAQHGVWIKGLAKLTLEHNTIELNTMSNIDVMERADPLIENNVIRLSAKCGVCFGENALGTLRNNVIEKCEFSNVGILPGADVTIVGNKITESKQHGVLAKTGAKGRIEGNVIATNTLANVKVEEGALVVVGANK